MSGLITRRRVAAVASVPIALLALGLTVGACLSGPTYRGDKSDHFDGSRFYDDKPARGSSGGFLKWQATRKPGHWPDAFIDAAPGPAPEKSVEGARMRVTFVNHATVLIQMEGKNILTDPIWSERASPFSFIGPARIRPPGIRFEDLPPIHAVVLSHNHYDHMDIATLLRLRDAHRPLIIAGLGNDELLAEHGLEAKAVDWGDEVPLAPLTIRSVPNQHFSSRGLTDGDGTLWSAYLIEGAHAGRAYFAGDTGYGAHFAKNGERFSDAHGVNGIKGIRLAVLPIGAYRPEWFMGAVHTTPAQAVQAALDLKARTSVAIHFGTFPLADDGMLEPVKDLYSALDRQREQGKHVEFWVLEFGEGRDVPP